VLACHYTGTAARQTAFLAGVCGGMQGSEQFRESLLGSARLYLVEEYEEKLCLSSGGGSDKKLGEACATVLEHTHWEWKWERMVTLRRVAVCPPPMDAGLTPRVRNRPWSVL
jgi:hypothetical protein